MLVIYIIIILTVKNVTENILLTLHLLKKDISDSLFLFD